MYASTLLPEKSDIYDVFLLCSIDYSTSDVLWECLNMFSAATYKLATKSLIMFTWRSNPHLGKYATMPCLKYQYSIGKILIVIYETMFFKVCIECLLSLLRVCH